MLIPYEDKVAVITPINILFIGGGEFGSLMKIKLMLLPQPTYCSLRWRILTPHEDKVDGCYYPSQHIVQNGWQNLMWWWSWCDDVMMWWCDDVMMWWCDDVMMWWCDDVMMWWCDDDGDGDGDGDGDDDDDDDDDDDHDDCKCGATFGLGRTCFRRLRFDLNNRLLLFPFIKAGNLASCLVLMPYWSWRFPADPPT